MIGRREGIDVYIIEGMKYSPYPKVEVVRQEISDKSVCDENSLICIATDVVSQKDVKCPVYDMDIFSYHFSSPTLCFFLKG